MCVNSVSCNANSISCVNRVSCNVNSVSCVLIMIHVLLVAVIPDPRAARSLRFSPVDGYHPSMYYILRSQCLVLSMTLSDLA